MVVRCIDTLRNAMTSAWIVDIICLKQRLKQHLTGVWSLVCVCLLKFSACFTATISLFVTRSSETCCRRLLKLMGLLTADCRKILSKAIREHKEWGGGIRAWCCRDQTCSCLKVVRICFCEQANFKELWPTSKMIKTFYLFCQDYFSRNPVKYCIFYWDMQSSCCPEPPPAVPRACLSKKKKFWNDVSLYVTFLSCHYFREGVQQRAAAGLSRSLHSVS